MTDLDLSQPHILIGPHRYAYANWWGACTCGAEFFGASDEDIRTAGLPHREAERRRLTETKERA